MKKKLRVLIVLIILGAAAGVALPLLNLAKPLPASKLATLKPKSPDMASALHVLEKKCVHCHTSEVQLPWYAKLPVAKQIIAHDINVGTDHSDFIREFFPAKPGPVSEVMLSKIEYTTVNRTMPPPPFLLMHWDLFMKEADDRALLTWIRQEREKHHATPGNPPEVMQAALQPLPDTVEVDAKKVALGEKLFNDVRLSKDNTVSCATCHDVDKGGADQLPFSKGVGGAEGDINDPTVFNSGFQFALFWDGRAADLEEQADGPVNNPIEMASNWEEVTAKLNQDAAFTQEFLAVYPDGYKKENFVEAIAEYERTLLTPAPFDAFLKGDKSALDDQQQKGYELFNTLGCYTCHTGVILGGKSYEKMGLRADYFGDRGDVIKRDYGRFNVTGDEYDRFRLKTPTLRNVADTFPYMHDSTVETLEEAVDVMVKYQVGKTVTQEENQALVSFLHSLTGKYEPGAATPSLLQKAVKFMESFS
jgi:cytochrome c peroxidase